MGEIGKLLFGIEMFVGVEVTEVIRLHSNDNENTDINGKKENQNDTGAL